MGKPSPYIWHFRCALLFLFLATGFRTAFAQGGPPYYTNDPGTPGNHNWEINIGYMPFLYTDQSVSHVPDIDINYGLGKSIQLTYENAWLRDADSTGTAKYGLGQDQLGVKWRFFDKHHWWGMAVSVFPQLSINNPNHSAERGITPRSASFMLPLEFAKKIGPVQLNWEAGYNFVHGGPNGWILGAVAGHDVTKNFELDAEFFTIRIFHAPEIQESLELGARYKLHPPFIVLAMAGRSLLPSSTRQPYFVAYFGMQFLLPPKPFKKED
jgi:hypothetical protein